MRKSMSVVAIVIALSAALPLAAAPSRQSSDSFFTRIVKFVRGIITPLDLNEPTPPKP